MNTPTARHLANRMAELIEMSSIFDSRFGKDYCLKPGSPAEAWDLHNASLTLQSSIARLLDPVALENPLQRFPMWWKRHETLDACTATLIGQEAFHLIACCASFEAAQRLEPSPAILCSQRVIAGGLHPSSLLIAQAEIERVQKAS